MADKILVCVAWPYSNGDMHIGHIAGAYLPSDIFARYHRLRGNDVLMVSGSDTHGTPITVRAEEEGISPRAVVDRYHPRNAEMMRRLGISFDLFTETDTENHWAVTQDLFKTHLEHGYLYRDSTAQLYCVPCAKWLADRYVEGICPHCGYESARGDQCDNCGRTHEAITLIKPRCKYCGGSEIEVRETEHFFLDLGRLNDPLLSWLNDGRKEHWRPNVINFTRSRLESRELRGRPITRDISWGITIPVPGWESKRIYVWYDAVIGYLAASKEWAQVVGAPEAWRPWWDAAARSYYFIGKDNIEFHTIIWPGMLIGYDPNLSLPYDVPANEYLNVEGRKLSKSRRWSIEMGDALDRYASDPWRYALAAGAPEAQDTNFTWEEFVRRNNEELVATWGNLANRVLGFAYRRFEGQVPAPGELDDADRTLLDQVPPIFEQVTVLLETVKLKPALVEAMRLAHEANRYLNLKEPWQQIKTDPQGAATTVFVALRVIDTLKTLLSPFLPFTCQELHGYLGYSGNLFGRLYIEELAETERKHLVLRYDGSTASGRWAISQLAAGQRLQEPKPLFLKLEPSLADAEVERMMAGA